MEFPSLDDLAKLPAVSRYVRSSLPVSIEKLEFDSRNADYGTLFFALPGTHTDGHQFLDAVWKQGCRAVVVSHLPDNRHPDTAYLMVTDARSAMSHISAAFYKNPSLEIPVIGVTGTDGKSSTVWYIHQFLELSGRPSGFFSTVQWKAEETIEHNVMRQSTPEAPQIHNLLRRMIEAGKKYAVLESTSHGLSPKTSRLADVHYQTAVFTNVTLEHLEFHGTVEQYRKDKARLFEALTKENESAFGVVNLDDPHHDLFIQAAGSRDVFTYSCIDDRADLFCSSIKEIPSGLDLELVWKKKKKKTHLPIPGRFNAENLMAALLSVSLTIARKEGLDLCPFDFLPFVGQLTAVKGRMNPLHLGQPFEVVVDYAHTPGAYEKVLPAAKASCMGKLIMVFGSAGERDHEKRPLQGALADRWADYIVLTDEDPRLEGSQPILTDIAQGIKNKQLNKDYWMISSRPEAIKKAFKLAQKGDLVLLLGKGHEQTIVTDHGPVPYDEESTAREALAELGWQG